MRMAIFRAMYLMLVRDRAGLAMAFVLPPLVYLLFAMIFSAASSGEIGVRVVLVDELQSAQSERLIRHLFEDSRIRRIDFPGQADEGGTDAAARALHDGDADVAFVIRRNARPLDDLSQEGRPPILLMGDPGRGVALSIARGALQDAFFRAIPEATLRSVAGQIDQKLAPFTEEQRARLDRALEAMGRSKVSPLRDDDKFRMDRVMDQRAAFPATDVPVAVTYYAGAVTILFLLFSSLTGALSLLEERESGLLDRLATSPGGATVVVDGKFLFLILQGIIQAAVIFVVAWLGFGIPLVANIGPWFATTLAAAVAAAGLALAFVSACRTRQQAHTLGQMGIVVLAAIGGSMVPRYLMPEQIQAVGWATPTTWAVETYSAIFHRGDPIAELLPAWAVLALGGVVGLVVARFFVWRSI